MVSVLPFVVDLVGVEVAAETCIDACVEHAVGVVATPPVGEVKHYVACSTEVVELEAIETLALEPVEACANTDQR